MYRVRFCEANTVLSVCFVTPWGQCLEDILSPGVVGHIPMENEAERIETRTPQGKIQMKRIFLKISILKVIL